MALMQFLKQYYSSSGDDCAFCVDDQTSMDNHSSFCNLIVQVNHPETDGFDLILKQVPWDEHVEAWVDKLGGKWSETSTGRTLTISLTTRNITDIRKLAEVIRKVAGRGRRYLDRNWKWVTRRTAASLQHFADLLKDYRHARRTTPEKQDGEQVTPCSTG